MAAKQVPQFLSKLYKMTNNPSHQDCLAWSEDGGSFWVSDIGGFSRDVLPTYYKHNNYASFVRQLNMYGFHRSTDSKGKATPGNSMVERFEHPNFKFGREDLLIHIQRKPSAQKKRTTPSERGDVDEPAASSPHFEQDERVSRLERQVNLLNVQTQNLIQQHTRLQESVVYIIRLLNRFNISETALAQQQQQQQPQQQQQQQQQQHVQGSMQTWGQDPNLGAHHAMASQVSGFGQAQQSPFGVPQQGVHTHHHHQHHQAVGSSFGMGQHLGHQGGEGFEGNSRPMESDLQVLVQDDDVETMDLDAMLASFAADHSNDMVPVQ